MMQTIKTADTVEDAVVDTHKCQYQYKDGDMFMFMDTESVDTVQVPADTIGTKEHYCGKAMSTIF